MAQDFKQIKAWQRGHQVTLDVYRQTRRFPREALFGLTSQMRRAAASIPTNIAEGSGRRTDMDFARFMDVAHGSTSELAYHALLARDLGYLPDRTAAAFDDEIDQISRMIYTYADRLRG